VRITLGHGPLGNGIAKSPSGRRPWVLQYPPVAREQGGLASGNGFPPEGRKPFKAARPASISEWTPLFITKHRRTGYLEVRGKEQC
jgi:hypothetical protein